jgi:predicted transcriptional regulator
VKLIQKDVEGFYHLTPYGELSLQQFKGAAFTSQYRRYFVSHSVTRIPHEFIYRIGELSDGTYVNDIMVAFTNVEKVIRDADEYLWVITDQHLPSHTMLHRKAYERGVKERDIEPKDWVVPAKLVERVSEEIGQDYFNQMRSTGVLEERLLERLDVYLYMSEKEVAAVAFPLVDGRFDYLGFTSTDERMHTYCKDLFLYYWEHAQPRINVVEELYRWMKKRTSTIYALKQIDSGEVVSDNDLMLELESFYLIKHGKLTRLGKLVYTMLKK